MQQGLTGARKLLAAGRDMTWYHHRHDRLQAGNVMKFKNIREILAQLSRELQRAEDIDIDARQTLKKLQYWRLPD